ncbi:MAG TPA: hypothetical protein VJA66_06795 [Thermoanaerobaculia bacterium]
MLRVAAFLLVLFSILLVLRALRQVLAFFLRPPSRPPAPREVAGEMVRDPVCGTWIDRRLAMPAGSGAGIVSVCSEKCRNALEAARR